MSMTNKSVDDSAMSSIITDFDKKRNTQNVSTTQNSSTIYQNDERAHRTISAMEPRVGGWDNVGAAGDRDSLMIEDS